MELKLLDAPFSSMREMLKKFRDGIVAAHEIERLRLIVTVPQEAPHALITASPMQSHAQEVKPPQKAAQEHSLKDAQKAYFDANTEWKEKQSRHIPFALNDLLHGAQPKTFIT